MKLRIASLTILCLVLGTIPTLAQQHLYDNGPINGTTDAWTINFGFQIADSFTLSSNSTVGGFMFGVWEYPGDTLTSVGWEIDAYPFSGTRYGSGTASGSNLTDRFISVNQYGYDIDKITVTGLNVALASGGPYWLGLLNATVPSGDPVYWDENSGAGCGGDDGHGGGCPSTASGGGVGTDPSEAFTVNGTGGTTPEPDSFVLLGSGVLGLAGLLRRKLG
jgi:PEP-CTERM motif